MIRSNQVITMIYRALNLLDARLVNHGSYVAAIMKDMLEADGVRDAELKKKLCILSLLHDVGAYRIREINNILQVETASAWEHSIYGYLFLKEFPPLRELAGVILYHHAEYDKRWEAPQDILRYAQLLYVADRVEIWHRSNQGGRKKALTEYLKKKSGSLFSEEAVACYLRADEQFDTYNRLEPSIVFDEIAACDITDEEEKKSYLWLMVHSIDFRSSVTVTHTVGVVEIACQLARRLGLSKEEQQQIYYGALLHDIGKIGTPVAILEKAGRLTEPEMKIMREHVVLGEEIIRDCVDEKVARTAMRHHEKLDGTGYPLGLTEKELTLPERLLTVADIVSALSMSRSYKEAFPKEKVFAILQKMEEDRQIDGSVLAVMKADYDEIIEEAQESMPSVRKAHERMGEEYQKLWKYTNEKEKAG